MGRRRTRGLAAAAAIAVAASCAAPRMAPRDPGRICPPGTESTLTRFPGGQARELVCWKRDAASGHVQHGPHIRWYPGGRQSYEADYVEGRLDGAVTTWREDGSVASERVYRDGRLLRCRLYPAAPCTDPVPPDTAAPHGDAGAGAAGAPTGRPAPGPPRPR